MYMYILELVCTEWSFGTLDVQEVALVRETWSASFLGQEIAFLIVILCMVACCFMT